MFGENFLIIFRFFLVVVCIKFSNSKKYKTNQPIYFTQNQPSYYIIDSYVNQDGVLNQNTHVVIDCLVESSNRFKRKLNIKWMKDTFDHNQFSSETQLLLETNKDVLQNGSLKLSYKTKISASLVPGNHLMFPISSFRCLASDSFGKILSRPYKIYRFIKDRADDDAFLRQPQNSSVNIGNRVLLRCKPNLGNHLKNEKNVNLVHYEWFKDSKPLVLEPTMSIYKDGSLEMLNVKKSDSGLYSCVVQFRLAKFESRQAYVEIKEPRALTPPNKFGADPKFKLWPEDRVAQEDDQISFECLAENDPTHGLNSSFSYIWSKDGLALDPKFNKHVQIVQGVSLRIESVLESDSGSYTCRICSNHPLGNQCDERSGFLKVLVAPRFIKKPSNLNVTLKSDAEFECSAYGVPHPSIQWYKNGEPIYPSEYFQFDSNQGNLKILGIIAQDEGYYQCVASNDLDTIQSISQLVVHTDDYNLNYDYDSSVQKSSHSVFFADTTTTSAIIHLSSPQNLKTNLIRTKSIEIEWKPPAVVRGTDKLSYSINWRAEGTSRQRQINTTDTSYLIDDLKPNTVYIINVRAFAMATYGPSVEIEAITDQRLSNAPIDFKAELVDYYTPDGVLSFSPTLKFKWKRPNSNNLLKYRLYYQHLHYGPVVNSDLHSNEFRPSIVDQYDDGGTNDGFSDDFYYEIRNQEEDKTIEKYINIDIPADFVNSDHYEFLLEDLLKYSSYKFRLVAIDMNYFDKIRSLNSENNFIPSESEPFDEYIDESYMKENSVAILIETPSDVPDGAPESVIAETVNTTAILLKWELPALDKRNGPIIGFKITVKESDKQMWHLDVDNEPRVRLMSGFLPAQKYSFRVVAKTVNGSGPASDWVIAETFAHEMDESRVPGQPAQIHTEPTDESIVIQWAPPLDSNYTLVRKYLLTYGIGFPKIEIEISGNKNSFILDNLVPSSQYVVSLRAGNNAGFGMEILKDVFTKKKLTLNENQNLFPPLNVQAVAISSRTVEVRWTDWHLRPDESIVDDRVYTVRYKVADMTNAKYMYKNSTERNVIINDLHPNTLYDFAVRLSLNGKESPWSMTTSQMTMESSPAPSQINIISDPNNPANAIITWKAPNLLHNSGYIIYYLDETNFKDNRRWNNEIINSYQSTNQLMRHTLKNLKAETIYYFKIQARNSRAYGTSSSTVLFKTPNSNGVGGGQIVTSNEDEPTVVLNKNENSPLHKVQLEISFIWVITACISALFLIVVILVAVLACKKTQPKSKDKNFNRNNLTSSTKPFKNRSDRNDELDDDESYQKNALLQQHQHHLLNTIPNLSNNSTLLRQKTPHHQPLLINNPNHMMMNVMNPISLSNTHNSDMEYYANNQAGLFTGNSHANSETSCFNSEQHYQIQNSNFNQMHNFGNRNGDHYTDEQTSSAIQAANAAFNSPFNPSFIPTVNLNQNNDSLFLRQAVKPRPIAIPINSNSSSNPLDQSSIFSSNNPARKSYKNLPVATATLISNQPINFANSNSQKLHYTAKPYIIDNQVQSTGDYSAHSPASSSHSGCPGQVYDRIGNINASTSSSKSLLQPLKSFSNANNSNHVHSSSVSIPNTPSKHCEAKEFKSPAKKQLMVSLSSNTNTTSTSVSKPGSNCLINGKSMDNVYEKKRSDEGMTQEMANLEGIMKDLNAITAKQFEC